MAGQKAVKPDPRVWIPLLEEYRLTSLPHDTVLRGTLRSELDENAPEVLEAMRVWPASAYVQSEGGETDVVLVYQLKEASPRIPWLHIGLFLATVLTTLGSGALMADLDPFGTAIWSFGDMAVPYPTTIRWGRLWAGASFAIPFLVVLMAHEMGHYAAARIHRVRASLPYFIPFPPYYSVIGTLGAFIRLRGPMVRRAVLFDVGSSGPFASFVVSLPLLVVGLALSETVAGQAQLNAPYVIGFAGQTIWLGNGLLVHGLASLVGPGSVGEQAIQLHPLAVVGWLGLFVTTLNLLPLGQLDGGHILYALAPEHYRGVVRLFLFALVPMGLLWWGWWGWVVVILVVHRGRVVHPPLLQPEPRLTAGRRILAWLLIAIFFATFVPAPLQL